MSQIDLPKSQVSGLVDAERVLRRVTGIAITQLTSADIVRHPLAACVVDAYDAARVNDLPLIGILEPVAELPRGLAQNPHTRLVRPRAKRRAAVDAIARQTPTNPSMPVAHAA